MPASHLALFFLLIALGPSRVLAASTPADEMMRVEFFQTLETGEAPKGPLSDGMEQSLPMNFLEAKKFISFKLFRDAPRAPLAVSVFFNGIPAKAQDLQKVFTEDVLALIPQGEQIRAAQDAQQRTVWHYPLGTQVIHFVTLKNGTIFELRMAQKVEEKRWAFGIYRPEDGALRLQTYSGFLEDSFTVDTREHGRIAVDLKHIPLTSCQNCHARTSSARYQYPSLPEVGPCEFTPPNPHILKEWAPRFQSAFGYAPIAL